MKKRFFCLGILVLAVFVFIVFQIANKDSQQDVKNFTAFFNVPGETRDEDNDIKNIIAKKTGAKCEEIWLVGQTADEAISSYIASGDYPDFISGSVRLMEAGALIPLDTYWDAYPNIKNYMTEDEWDLLRQEDGHIYWMPQFGVVKGKSSDVIHEGEAFWVQTRVLKWAGYPQVNTVEEYFALLEDYMEANPETPSGEANIPFTILCDDWRYFCLENPPQFLDGYPNDGCCMVDPVRHKVMDYNVTPTAKRYFQILNEEYKKGMVDPESFVQSYSEYLNKLSTGRVLGFVDQWWQFAYDINNVLQEQDIEGCGYVPLPITIDEGIRNQWHVQRGNEIDTSEGIAITTSCSDIEGALQFLNDLLDDEIMKLRFWGVEDLDYLVDENGVFYHTEQQRDRTKDALLGASHFCVYSYFPRWEGSLNDGINAFSPEYQPAEFLADLPEDIAECLQAYGCETYVEMLGSNEEPGPWYPMYSYTDMLTSDTDVGSVKEQINDVKHYYLPQVIMADDFDAMWNQYMEQYEACRPEILMEALQKEADRRIAAAQ